MREFRLIDEIVRADPEFMSVLGTVYQALQTGELKHEDVYAYSRAENIGNFERLVALFDAGNLFRAQKMDFDSWLKAVDYGSDVEAWKKFHYTADLCGIKEPDGEQLRRSKPCDSETTAYWRVWRFASRRVFFSINVRGLIRDNERQALMLQWSDQNSKEHWDWR